MQKSNPTLKHRAYLYQTSFSKRSCPKGGYHLKFVSTESQLPDFFTKPSPPQSFCKIGIELGNIDLPQ